MIKAVSGDIVQVKGHSYHTVMPVTGYTLYYPEMFANAGIMSRKMSPRKKQYLALKEQILVQQLKFTSLYKILM